MKGINNNSVKRDSGRGKQCSLTVPLIQGGGWWQGTLYTPAIPLGGSAEDSRDYPNWLRSYVHQSNQQINR